MDDTDASPTPPKARVLVVEDHPIVLHGLTLLIDDQADLSVCGTATTVPAAVQLAEKLAPDIAVVDLALGDQSGLELIGLLHQSAPALPVLVLSMHDEMAYAERALRAGARGYVMKREAMDHMLTALRRLLAGGMFVSDRLSTQLLAKAVNRPSSPIDTLSDREFEVFRLLAEGAGPTEAANRLGLSVKTVEAHRGHIKEKLGVKTAAELARVLSRWLDRQT
jgi:DNA-binding NarL/FixJ family response regulator